MTPLSGKPAPDEHARAQRQNEQERIQRLNAAIERKKTDRDQAVGPARKQDLDSLNQLEYERHQAQQRLNQLNQE